MAYAAVQALCVLAALAQEPVSFQQAVRDCQSGNYQQALTELQAYKKLFPNNAEVRYYISVCERNLRQPQQTAPPMQPPPQSPPMMQPPPQQQGGYMQPPPDQQGGYMQQPPAYVPPQYQPPPQNFNQQPPNSFQPAPLLDWPREMRNKYPVMGDKPGVSPFIRQGKAARVIEFYTDT